MAIGIPLKLLYEGLGHIVTIELKSGDLYRGTLTHVEDNMNCMLEHVNATMRDGKPVSLEQCYLRGSQIRFCILPDMLKNAPMFKLAANAKNRASVLGAAGNKKAFAARFISKGSSRGRSGRGLAAQNY
ncbi:LSM domain protein [Cryptosporidium meleagridis]|uniref:Small nuclear ribonucleoprotein Sm D3 n=1 Tax=Cryptosporidium meleagridis TaxID=93969 RepID=A0A2P4YWR0_9CRYT|nr:LSM domain protein [Cryptosporidium meleagridis]